LYTQILMQKIVCLSLERSVRSQLNYLNHFFEYFFGFIKIPFIDERPDAKCGTYQTKNESACLVFINDRFYSMRF
jgi:hypothetical protein